MIIAFILSMPNCGSWNGKWSGEGDFYAITHNFGKSKSGKEKAKSILGNYYSYSFGDGWEAWISTKEVNAKEAKTIIKNSKGFCGYNWMVNEIIQFGIIKTLAERKSNDQKSIKKNNHSYLEKQKK